MDLKNISKIILLLWEELVLALLLFRFVIFVFVLEPAGLAIFTWKRLPNKSDRVLGMLYEGCVGLHPPHPTPLEIPV